MVFRWTKSGTHVPEVEQRTGKLLAHRAQNAGSDGSESVKHLEKGNNREDVRDR